MVSNLTNQEWLDDILKQLVVTISGPTLPLVVMLLGHIQLLQHQVEIMEMQPQQ